MLDLAIIELFLVMITFLFQFKFYNNFSVSNLSDRNAYFPKSDCNNLKMLQVLHARCSMLLGFLKLRRFFKEMY